MINRTLEYLEGKKTDLEKEIQQIKNLIELSKDVACRTKDETIEAKALIFLYSQREMPIEGFQNLKSIKEIAYDLAKKGKVDLRGGKPKFEKDFEDEFIESQEKRFISAYEMLFDEVDFIFSYTHYDECSNGFYFRRS